MDINFDANQIRVREYEANESRPEGFVSITMEADGIKVIGRVPIEAFHDAIGNRVDPIIRQKARNLVEPHNALQTAILDAQDAINTASANFVKAIKAEFDIRSSATTEVATDEAGEEEGADVSDDTTAAETVSNEDGAEIDVAAEAEEPIATPAPPTQPVPPS